MTNSRFPQVWLLLALIGGALSSCRASRTANYAGMTVSPTDLSPVVARLDERLPQVLGFNHVAWGGVNPPGGGDLDSLRIFIVDPARCAPTEPDCGKVRAARDTCLAVDKTVILCDASFLAMVYGIAGYVSTSGSEKLLHDGTLSPLVNAVPFADRMRLASAAWSGETDFDALGAQKMLDTVMIFVVLHELGHIQNGDLTKSTDEPSDWFSDTTIEAKADLFALERMWSDPLSSLRMVDFFNAVTSLIVQDEVRAVDAADPAHPTMEEDWKLQEGMCQRIVRSSRHGLPVARGARIARHAGNPLSPAMELNLRMIATSCAPQRADEFIARSKEGEYFPAPKVSIQLIAPGRPPLRTTRYLWDKNPVARRMTIEQTLTKTYPGNAPVSQGPQRLNSVEVAQVTEQDHGESVIHVKLVETNNPMLTGKFDVFRLMTDRGVPVGTNVQSDSIRRREAAQLINVADTMLELVPFPEEPIGVGARWSMTVAQEQDQFDTMDTTTYELIANEGDKLTVKAVDGSPEAANGEGRTRETLRQKGTSTFEIDLRSPFAKRESHYELDYSEQANGVSSTTHRVVVISADPVPLSSPKKEP